MTLDDWAWLAALLLIGGVLVAIWWVLLRGCAR